MGKLITPPSFGKILDLRLRKVLHNPKKILSPYIKEGMDVLDVGCGSGFFTVEIGELVGNGSVIGADIQKGMLDQLEKKINNSGLGKTVKIHKAESNSINLKQKFDFILAFYTIHEVENSEKFIEELKESLKEYGLILVSEPKIEVSKEQFKKTIKLMEQKGFKVIEAPNIHMSRSALLKHAH
ncbi:MAG: class I SAM-dependent methyltransferase [Methanobacteriaceae archaeon]